MSPPTLPVAGWPLVSIGLPLHNAELYLRQALDSLVAQDYPRIEILVSDNASDDGTGQICVEYSLRYPQIQYHRAEQNMGAVWNFNRVLELAEGKYFMWAAYDDLRHPRYVSACVEKLEADPEAVLCCTEIRFVDEVGADLAVQPSVRGLRPVAATARERLALVARAQHWYDIYGLLRAAALRETRRAVPVWGFDVVLLLELCLRGTVLLVPEPLFAYRRFRSKQQGDLAAGLTGVAHAVSVNWSSMTIEMLRSIESAPCRRLERLVMSGEFLFLFSFRNLPVAAGIRSDLTQSIHSAVVNRRWRELALLSLLGLLIYPTQSRMARLVYRATRRAGAAALEGYEVFARALRR